MKNRNYKILIVDDEQEYQNVFAYILESNGYSVVTCSSGYDAINLIETTSIDLIITDLKMPQMDGNDLIKKIKKAQPELSIMVMTAFGTIENAVQSIKEGAQGYFIKGSDPEVLLVEIDKLCKIKELQISNSIFKKGTLSNIPFLETESSLCHDVLMLCKKAAKSDINVLLLGESGVGKEVMANYIHNLSQRKDNHFIPVNCQSFSSGIVESELFGHEKGAFTGAVEKRIGRFEEANNGTLFLDEIGDLPIETQGKLLRALETKSIERVGSNRNIDLNIRLISATNKNLDKAITAETFREDLFYRINTFEITIPPLRERKEDLPKLIAYFLKIVQKDQKKIIDDIDKETMETLLNYSYPGNIRELKNIIERLVVLSDNGLITSNELKTLNRTKKPTQIENYNRPLKVVRAEFEKDYISNAIKKNGGNVSQTAESLDISSRQLWNKISEYDIKY